MDLLGYGRTLEQRQRQRQKESKTTTRKTPKKVNTESLSDRITRLQSKALDVVEEILGDADSKSADRLKAASLIFDISGLRKDETQALRTVMQMGAVTASQADSILSELQGFHRRAADILAGHDKEST